MTKFPTFKLQDLKQNTSYKYIKEIATKNSKNRNKKRDFLKSLYEC